MVDIVKVLSPEPGCFMVGSGVTAKGTFSVPERAVINGAVEGEITAREMLVGPSGKITGTVTAEVIDVRGEVVENVTASKALILRASGRATGSIAYAELEIEKGAQLRGALTMLSPEAVPDERPAREARNGAAPVTARNNVDA